MIDVQQDFRNIRLPKTWKHNGSTWFFDPIRKKSIQMTPEEEVRQKTISFLIKQMHVPKQMIRTEESLRHYQCESKRRADIIVEGFREKSNECIPLAVVECKAQSVSLLNEYITWQAMDYADMLGCDYVFLTNGYNMRVAKWDGKLYQWLADIPTYEDLCAGAYTALEKNTDFARTAFGKWNDGIQERYDYNEFGKDTPQYLLPFLVNFHDCLLDTSRTLPKKKYELFELKQDLGTIEWASGNASGGQFNGLYRAFEVIYKRKHYVVSFGFSSYTTWSRLEESHTALCVGVELNGKRHHSAQIVMDKYLRCTNDQFTLVHDGRIAVGNVGSGKKDELKRGIARCYPKLLYKDEIFLGSFKNNRLFYLDDPDIVYLMENLITYALIRDDYRNFVKKKAQKKKGEER